MKTIGERLLRLPEVLERVPFGKTTLYRLMREGSFPKNIQLGSNMVAWVASENESIKTSFIEILYQRSEVGREAFQLIKTSESSNRRVIANL